MIAPGSKRTRAGVGCAVVGCAVVAMLLVAGCSSSKHPTAAASSATGNPTNSVSSAVATRWWSNAAVAVGSVIDPVDPTSAAAKLAPSRSDYCGMLKQTLAAGKSILPSGSATDPKLVVSSAAFIVEIERVTPSAVSGPWQVLGPVILTLVKSGTTVPSNATVDSAGNIQAAQAIADDAKANCGGLDLSKIITG
ncbi:MAG: hypothetical protein M3O28_13205 [Actinomycetota bacterium]|nr:hypothetical protein [Actinomycetota bacterium]